ncbi:hypothetical protein [Rhizobium rhizosphaerae]|uniref:hypothetical protein n=1 Tax=Xaviernesmea rhizosphaerae TaxID=1672749 RepID=UPI00117B89B8|nr:hypothetical protein [Xaviernesmea rhizosphaerae]
MVLAHVKPFNAARAVPACAGSIPVIHPILTASARKPGRCRAMFLATALSSHVPFAGRAARLPETASAEALMA